MGRRAMVGAVAVVAGCSFAPHAGQDGGAGGEAAVDAAPDAPLVESCLAHWHDHTATFAAPLLLSELTPSGTTAADPFVTQDELTIYFSSQRTQSNQTSMGQDIWTASRSSPSAAFGASTLFAPANSFATESKLSLTADGSDFVVASDRGGNLDLWEASDGSAGSAFPVPTTATFPSVDTSAAQLDPHISEDGLRIYYAPTDFGAQHIALTRRTARGSAFDAPTELANLDTDTEGDEDPTVTADETVIVFSTRRDVTLGVQIYYATRASAGSDFEAPLPLASINTPGFEGDPEVAGDGCRLYFSSDRDGRQQLYQATMQFTP